MSIPDQPINANRVPDSVIAWRHERLRQAGLSPELVRRVAARSAYDLHALLGLLERGCPAELALRILAPIDEPQEAW